MNKRTQECYDYVLEFIKKRALEFGIVIEPKFVISDFELGEINALKVAFPLALVIGCWFHFCQAIQTWFTKNKPGHGYNNNYSANRTKSLILCLPWLPIKFVTEFWKKYVIGQIKNTFNATSSDLLINYINSTWFERYKPEDWNIHNKPVWTNNMIENNNKYLNEMFGNHPDKISFIKSAFKINSNFINDWIKFMKVKKTYPIQNSLKFEKKQKLMDISKKYWPKEVIKHKRANTKTAIKYCTKFMNEILEIRVKYSKYFKKLQEKSSENLTVKGYLESKSLTNSKKDLKQCKICKQTMHSSVYKNHIKECTAICDICGRKCSTKESLLSHLEKHKTEKNKKYKYYCKNDGCCKKYVKEESFLKHQAQCIKLTCSICKKFSTFREILLKRHIAGVHQKGDFQFKCKYCKKEFLHNSRLNDHIKEYHTSNNSYHCDNCSRGFKSRTKLNNHKRKCIFKKFNEIKKKN